MMLRSPPLLTCLPLPFSTSRICLSRMSTTPSPICPKFISLEGTDIYSRSNPDGIRFSLVSYNILAQVALNAGDGSHPGFAVVKLNFFNCGFRGLCEEFFISAFSIGFLKWKARSQAILTVLQSLDADFLCLQEVDEYDKFYKKNIEIHGYSSIYIQRSGQKRDGCGIFYKHNCADLLLEERIEYNDLVDLIQAESNVSADKHSGSLADQENNGQQKTGSSLKSSPEDRGDPNDPRVRYKRDCVGVMAAFKLKDQFHHVVIVANTHLYWDPEWADVKLAQAKYLLSRLAKFKTLVSDKFECSPSVILAGDFNSIPGDKVYQYLVSGNSLSASLVECFDELPIPLCSLYGHTRGEPAFTNCTPDFTNTLDYIFFSPDDNIKPVSFLELPEPNSLNVLGGLPNYYHPSDHLPIGAEFEITRE